ncbi:MAG: hypothetical protein F4Z75_01700 [Synechococcus sp. SB0668_bin_15]|nr:hypothetical protein [Synechococcus sp. SB0668_bin_15]MXZ83590.1 hypothetical protein [Synechococcus sp. SB0666_bin_14]MYA90938.1 hypothetical protein [Synechococcus sp. SB0663_bin_10]MYC49938.1 hypothetical protein [Synechococcus sp. SB0662_bin_14]MYG46334.1 hypothetical protein [Synechococcus sp. SB0675_bin_6]MYJ59692.1 hypothetical protein [Synechococcus sp. SB0672_bin_6]MYK92379.1 hypothetical protein [Synechococcus sp. SB0669_bin_8]
MIPPVQPVPEPHDFEEKVRAPGRQWLATHPSAARPKDYWTLFKGTLAQGFENRCAYCAMYEPVGTVDHFASWHEDRSQAYSWENYRYCAQWINASKGKTPADKLLDPYTIKDGWFEIHLPSLHLQVSNRVPDALRERAAYVLERLHLRKDERVLRQRREWYRMFQDKEVSLKGLRKKAPLIAMAVTRAGRS